MNTLIKDEECKKRIQTNFTLTSQTKFGPHLEPFKSVKCTMGVSSWQMHQSLFRDDDIALGADLPEDTIIPRE